MMNTMKLIIKIPKQRRRALELYHDDSPFKQKVEKSRKLYSRKQKHRNAEASYG